MIKWINYIGTLQCDQIKYIYNKYILINCNSAYMTEWDVRQNIELNKTIFNSTIIYIWNSLIFILFHKHTWIYNNFKCIDYHITSFPHQLIFISYT